MDTGTELPPTRAKSNKAPPTVLPETELFIHLLVLLRIYDDGDLEKVMMLFVKFNNHISQLGSPYFSIFDAIGKVL